MLRAPSYHSSTSKRKKNYRSLLFALVNSTETESIAREVFQTKISSKCKQFATLPHISLLVFRHRSSDSRLVRQLVLQWLLATHWRRQHEGTFRRRSRWIFGKSWQIKLFPKPVGSRPRKSAFLLFVCVYWFLKGQIQSRSKVVLSSQEQHFVFSPHLTSRGLKRPIRKNRSPGERLEKHKQWCDYRRKFFSPRASRVRTCIALEPATPSVLQARCQINWGLIGLRQEN